MLKKLGNFKWALISLVIVFGILFMMPMAYPPNIDNYQGVCEFSKEDILTEDDSQVLELEQISCKYFEDQLPEIQTHDFERVSINISENIRNQTKNGMYKVSFDASSSITYLDDIEELKGPENFLKENPGRFEKIEEFKFIEGTGELEETVKQEHEEDWSGAISAKRWGLTFEIAFLVLLVLPTLTLPFLFIFYNLNITSGKDRYLLVEWLSAVFLLSTFIGTSYLFSLWEPYTYLSVFEIYITRFVEFMQFVFI